MFPSVSSCASTKNEFRSVDKHGHRRPSLIFLVSHLLRNYLTDSNETCLLYSPQCLVVQVQKKLRSVDKLGRLIPGSDLVKCPIDSLLSHLLQDHWSDFFRSCSECSFQCLAVQVPKQNRSVEKHAAVGHLCFFCCRISSETTGWIQMKLAYQARFNV